MAIVTMVDAVAGNVALAAEYNKVTANIRDLDARLGAVLSSSTAHDRLNTLESRTLNTSGNVGIGNQRLSDRLGAGVTTASTAAAQLAALQAVTGTAVDACYAYQTTAATLASDTWTMMTLQAEAFDTNALHSTSTNPSRITIQKAGIYMVSGMVSYQAKAPAGNNRRFAGVFLNGAAPLPIPGMISGMPTPALTFGGVTIPTPPAPVQLAVGDYLELGAYGSDAPSTQVTANFNSFLSVVYLRP